MALGFTKDGLQIPVDVLASLLAVDNSGIRSKIPFKDLFDPLIHEVTDLLFELRRRGWHLQSWIQSKDA